MTETEFLEIYRANAAAVFRYCAFRTGSTQEAEDLTAEVFTRLLAKGGTVPAGKRLPWLHAVARNLCSDFGRQRRFSTIDGLELAVEDPERVWLDDDARRAIARLSPKTQQVLFLRAIEDLPFERIAHILGMSETAARMRYHRATSKMRCLLEVKACPNETI